MTRSKRPKPREDTASLLGASAALAQPARIVSTLPVTALAPSPFQPRRRVEDSALEQLVASIRTQGVLQPLLVRPVGDGYEIVAGERRWRAAQLAGLAGVPVLIRELDDDAALTAALVENLQREDLTAIDEVDGTLRLVALRLSTTPEDARHRLMRAKGKGQDTPDIAVFEDVFALLGRESWLSFVKNKLRIAGWPQELQDAMRNGLPYSLAGVIAGAPVEIRAQLLEAAIAGASREDLRALAVKLLPPAPRQRFDETRVVSVARQLGSVRLLRGLNEAEQKALDTWLKKMPPLLAERLKELE
ncbi:ParB/RepB/Spo0J family partition protein [Deinococcus oregonensis]|uniref:ParB/RepB/Spo0J family partition protein n=1 Tax=Deinococcus oregonensis TaxID=1805970 RepID=A0ABV6AZH3_9DEIO